MTIKLIGTELDITVAINTFDDEYHAGFFSVWQNAQQFLTCERVTPEIVLSLAQSLRHTLHQYGAGEPGVPNHGTPNAPSLKTLPQFILGLSDKSLQRDLRALSQCRITDTTDKFDDTLFRCLHSLADGLFEDNTNVTYPMKAVLLMTGFMPAFDSQVRGGLKSTGFSGFGASRYLLPKERNTAGWLKISRLRPMLGDCWNRGAVKFRSAIERSCHPNLSDMPGRVFDILLFVQGRGRNPITTLKYDGRLDWYKDRDSEDAVIQEAGDVFG